MNGVHRTSSQPSNLIERWFKPDVFEPADQMLVRRR
jgi:hypothetical protein